MAARVMIIFLFSERKVAHFVNTTLSFRYSITESSRVVLFDIRNRRKESSPLTSPIMIVVEKGS